MDDSLVNKDKPQVVFISSEAKKRAQAEALFQREQIEVFTAPELNALHDNGASATIVIVDLEGCSQPEYRRYCEDMQGVSGNGCPKYNRLSEVLLNSNTVFLGALDGPLERYNLPCDTSGFEATIEWPINPIEFKRVKQIIDKCHYNHAHKHASIEKRRIYEAHMQLESQRFTESAIDPLTELCSPRSIMNKMQVEEARFQRHRRSFCLLMADVDQMRKTVDDLSQRHQLESSFIHESLIKQVADVLRDGLRAGDSISRWVEDTYLMLLPDTDLEGGKLLGMRIQRLFEQTKFTIGGTVNIGLTMTFSLVAYQGDKTLYQTIDQLEAMLAQGKETGGNCMIQTQFIE